jgi:hypothetical protein
MVITVAPAGCGQKKITVATMHSRTTGREERRNT